MAGCREYQVSDDPSLRLEFSSDTVRFDTLFTEVGSSTMQLMVYNRNASAMVIDRIWMEDGSIFLVNIDGEQELSRLTDLQINGGDSMFVFVRVKMKANNVNTPLLLTDRLFFHLSGGATQEVRMEVYGQDATRIRPNGKATRRVESGYTFTADKPYIIFDTLIIDGDLTIQPGAALYMHNGACIYALGDVNANGTIEQPILIRGDRLDNLFDSVPYHYAGGSWNGIYLQAEKTQTYSFRYVDILSGNIGLYCFSQDASPLPQLTMEGCRIHNHTLYGLVLLDTDAEVVNTEISNCASYCVYCNGGTHRFVHSTIASYFNYTSIRIQSTGKDESAAVFIDNLQKTAPKTNTSFYNSIITGFLKNQLVVATPFDQYYPGTFVGNYLKTDTLAIPHASGNTYWQESDTMPVFRKDFYKYKEYVYYDFRLDSLSPAIGIADSIVALSYPLDREGVSRTDTQPDAGCYQSHGPMK